MNHGVGAGWQTVSKYGLRELGVWECFCKIRTRVQYAVTLKRLGAMHGRVCGD